ncbi:hypothetical protein ACFFX0_04895 [Citricoccus parietis]|uniref:Uncharacterized protein n=1 Tax=Citricoccus parietis TaxID=592307 RepID=A0ABV5FV50_9MICC
MQSTKYSRDSCYPCTATRPKRANVYCRRRGAGHILSFGRPMRRPKSSTCSQFSHPSSQAARIRTYS